MKHTPGPWFLNLENAIVNPMTETVVGYVEYLDNVDEARANALLIAAATDLLAEVEREYTELADIHNNWPGRDTMQGQAKLCRLRDLIVKATGRDPQDVQDDYGTRSAIAKATGDA